MLQKLPILIVEDEWLVALDLAGAVADLDGRPLGPVASTDEALAIIDSHAVGGAILDARLAGCDVTPVALRLLGGGIPFVLHSGTGLPPALAASVSRIAVVMKPHPAPLVVERLWNEVKRLHAV